MIILPQRMSQMKDSDETFFIELYKIELRTGALYLAATDTDITFAGQEFLAIPLQRETIDKSVDNVIDDCNISLGDGDYDKLAYICNGFDFRGCNVDIIRIAYPDSLTNPDIFSWVFSGYIDSPSYSDGVFSCSLKTRMPNVNVPNRSCRLCCNSEFGDDECKMDLSLTEILLAQGSNKDKIILPQDYPENFWKDGVISIKGESRIILSSSGVSVTINYSFLQDVQVGAKATLIRGCDKTKETCKSRYNNMKNFSGFPAIPWEAMYK